MRMAANTPRLCAGWCPVFPVPFPLPWRFPIVQFALDSHSRPSSLSACIFADRHIGRCLSEAHPCSPGQRRRIPNRSPFRYLLPSPGGGGMSDARSCGLSLSSHASLGPLILCLLETGALKTPSHRISDTPPRRSIVSPKQNHSHNSQKRPHPPSVSVPRHFGRNAPPPFSCRSSILRCERARVPDRCGADSQIV
jgi:hypothetical protein